MKFDWLMDVTQKLGQISKIRPDQFWILYPSLRISRQLPAPVVNDGGDSFWKWKDFQFSSGRDLDLDLGSGHTAYHRASLVELYLQTKFHWNRINVLWTDGRTDWRIDGHLGATLLGRLIRVDLKEGWLNNYVGPPYCRAEMDVGCVACCPLVSRCVCRWADIYRRTDVIPLHYGFCYKPP